MVSRHSIPLKVYRNGRRVLAHLNKSFSRYVANGNEEPLHVEAALEVPR